MSCVSTGSWYSCHHSSLPNDEAAAACCGAGARYSCGTLTAGRWYFGPIRQPVSRSSTARIPKSAVFFIGLVPLTGRCGGREGQCSPSFGALELLEPIGNR